MADSDELLILQMFCRATAKCIFAELNANDINLIWISGDFQQFPRWAMSVIYLQTWIENESECEFHVQSFAWTPWMAILSVYCECYFSKIFTCKFKFEFKSNC